MAPTKRSRPAFSPPRIAKKNDNIARKKAANKPYNSRNDSGSARKRGRPSRAEQEESEDDESEGFENNGRSALDLVDMHAGEDDGSESEDESDGAEEEEDEQDTRPSRKRSSAHPNSSPEPDMILAEITTTNEPSDAAIPAKLVHRLLAHHFERGEKTKISTDARDLVSRYVEVFVREAIMRSAYEKDGKQTGDINSTSSGFLEVEDLERAAVQLCLDF